MSFVALFPLAATSSSVRFKVIAVQPNPPATLTLEKVEGEEATPALVPDPLVWKSVPLINKSIVQVATASISGLEPGSEVSVRAMEGGQELQRATARTLPRELDPAGAELRMILCSCYNQLNPESRNAAALFTDMFRAYGTPDLKIWCGDQVYLDSPAKHFMLHWTDTNEELATRHLEQYTRTWSTDHLGQPLARGSNVFTPDDHEYWNNAPDPNVVVPGLFAKNRRDAWMTSAKTLLSAFQGVPDDLGALMQPIVIPPLSIMVLDTRSNRSTAKKPVQFMTEEDLDRLERWVASLAGTGPGLLVIGQPLFLKAGDKFLKPKVLEDYSLADYDQFAKLLRILAAAPRDIAILSGDVHFTRIAEMTLLHTPNPRRIVEVINSPLALVVGLKHGQTQPAPALLKAPGAPPEITGARVETIQGFQSGDDSAVVLSISRFGLGVRITTDLWLNRASGGATRPFSTYQFELH